MQNTQPKQVGFGSEEIDKLELPRRASCQAIGFSYLRTRFNGNYKLSSIGEAKAQHDMGKQPFGAKGYDYRVDGCQLA